jgi:hypothetical protein
MTHHHGDGDVLITVVAFFMMREGKLAEVYGYLGGNAFEVLEQVRQNWGAQDRDRTHQFMIMGVFGNFVNS